MSTASARWIGSHADDPLEIDEGQCYVCVEPVGRYFAGGNLDAAEFTPYLLITRSDPETHAGLCEDCADFIAEVGRAVAEAMEL